MKQLPKKNQVRVSGRLVSEFVLDHWYKGNSFYKAELLVERKSGCADVFYIMAPWWISIDWSGFQEVTVLGEIRTRRNYENGRWKLFVYVYVHELLEVKDGNFKNKNSVFLKGIICKTPIYRTTFKGKRIADITIAVNRPHGKSSYIPCIVWEKDADMVKDLPSGTVVSIEGRLQSRFFERLLDDKKVKRCVAYEVSASHLKIF